MYISIVHTPVCEQYYTKHNSYVYIMHIHNNLTIYVGTSADGYNNYNEIF